MSNGEELDNLYQQSLFDVNNSACVDCSAFDTQFVDVTHGVFLCVRCQQIHRLANFEVRETPSRAEQLGDRAAILLSLVGNRRLNDIYLRHMDEQERRNIYEAHWLQSNDQLRKFIFSKYMAKTWHAKDSRLPTKSSIITPTNHPTSVWRVVYNAPAPGVEAGEEGIGWFRADGTVLLQLQVVPSQRKVEVQTSFGVMDSWRLELTNNTITFTVAKSEYGFIVEYHGRNEVNRREYDCTGEYAFVLNKWNWTVTEPTPTAMSVPYPTSVTVPPTTHTQFTSDPFGEIGFSNDVFGAPSPNADQQGRYGNATFSELETYPFFEPSTSILNPPFGAPTPFSNAAPAPAPAPAPNHSDPFAMAFDSFPPFDSFNAPNSNSWNAFSTPTLIAAVTTSTAATTAVKTTQQKPLLPPPPAHFPQPKRIISKAASTSSASANSASFPPSSLHEQLEQEMILRSEAQSNLELAHCELRDQEHTIEQLTRTIQALQDDKQQLNTTIAMYQTAKVDLIKQHVKNEDDCERIGKECFQLYHAVQQHKMQLITKAKTQVEEDKLCVICQSEVKSIALVPCGHVCTCKQCSDTILVSNKMQCPLCRKAITQKIPVFF